MINLINQIKWWMHFFLFLITVICKFFIYFIFTQWIGHRLMLPSQYVHFKKYKLGGGGVLTKSHTSNWKYAKGSVIKMSLTTSFFEMCYRRKTTCINVLFAKSETLSARSWDKDWKLPSADIYLPQMTKWLKIYFLFTSWPLSSI